MEEHNFKIPGLFNLEAGGHLEDIEITYHTSGNLTPHSKVIWICHALTANSDPTDWWPGMVGNTKFYNNKDYFIICANILGSCYGTTGPLSNCISSGNKYYRNFPDITVRDIVNAHYLLKQHLNIDKIHTLIGSSIGGFQAIEMALINPLNVEHLILLATNSKVTPWATAFNEAQRMAIKADQTFFSDIPNGGENGLKAARAMALLSYRSYEGYNITQFEKDEDFYFASRAVSYEQYQGEKLANRFNAYSYYTLSKMFDSHNVGRNRGGVNNALKKLTCKVLLIGIENDLLFPPEELKFINSVIPHSVYKEISSSFGHDGFLLESEQIADIIRGFYNK